jgi:hypothetical protein
VCDESGAQRSVDHHAGGARSAAVGVGAAGVPIGRASRSTCEAAACGRQTTTTAALLRQRAGRAIGPACAVSGRRLTALRARGRGHARAGVSPAAAPIASAELSVLAARRRLADAGPLARSRAVTRAAVGVGVAALALSATPPGGGATPNAVEDLAVARAAVGVASANLSDLPSAAFSVVRDAHRQPGTVPDRLDVQHALGGAAVVTRYADLSLHAASFDQRAPARGARLPAALAVPPAGLPCRLASGRWRRALATHTEIGAAVGSGLARTTRGLAFGSLRAHATVAPNARAHARE